MRIPKKNGRKRRPPDTNRRVLRKAEISIGKEARYIVECAQRCDARIVTIGALVFFSTMDGDAWMLDPEDRLALCLARGGAPLPYRIVENTTQFTIEWTATYAITSNRFVVADRTGEVTVFPCYPVEDLAKAERRCRLDR